MRKNRTAARLGGWLIVLASVLIAAPASGAPAEKKEDSEAATHEVVVGKATIRWHRSPLERGDATSQFVERYRRTTDAHLSGEPLPAPEKTPSDAWVPLGQGTWGMRMPVELISTMFVGPGGPYCSESSAPAPAAVRAPLVETEGATDEPR